MARLEIPCHYYSSTERRKMTRRRDEKNGKFVDVKLSEVDM